jgi:hypothetical protein
MHEARATSPRRGWVLLGAACLLAILILLLLTERHNPAPGTAAVDTALPPSSSPAEESAAENARRAAIAALGPIKTRPGTNAVDLYRQATGLYAGLSDNEKAMLAHWRGRMDPKAAPALYARIQPMMDLLRRARHADYVDWGLGPIPFEDAPANLARLNGERDLAVMALWDSAYRFQTDPDGAVGDLAAMDAMGRGGIDSLIGLLEQNSLHQSALPLLAQNAAAITAAAGPDLADIIGPGAAAQAFQTGMNGEASILQALMDQYADPATRSQAESVLGMAFTNGNGPAVTPQQMTSGLEWIKQTEEALAPTLTEPQPQFQQWWTQKLTESASMPGAGVMMPGLLNARTAAQATLVEDAMLQAGMALEQNDQTQFESILDPSTGQPFIYTQTTNGFQLGSPLKYRSKPVTLSFSTPAPQ